MTITAEEGQSLRDAVIGLTEAVQELQRMMREDYPKRDELEDKFVTKYGIRKRRRQYTLVMIAAIVGAYFFSMGTVSYCFLGGNSDGTVNPKPFCRLVPGYSQAVDNNQHIVGVFKHIVDTTENNSKRLDRLEQKH